MEAVGYDPNMFLILDSLLLMRSLVPPALSDRIPRRKVLVISSFLRVFWLGISGVSPRFGPTTICQTRLWSWHSSLVSPVGCLYPSASVIPRISHGSPLPTMVHVLTSRVSQQCDSRSCTAAPLVYLALVNIIVILVALKDIQYSSVVIFVACDDIEPISVLLHDRNSWGLRNTST